MIAENHFCATSRLHPNGRIGRETCACENTGTIICFHVPNLAHEPLLARIPVFTTPIRRWLKAGVVELEHYTNTETGTPQGGVISPLLANIALHGMERLFGSETPDGRHIRPSERTGLNRCISVIRYADDFVRHEAR